jgi:hypothetical protein
VLVLRRLTIGGRNVSRTPAITDQNAIASVGTPKAAITISAMPVGNCPLWSFS